MNHPHRFALILVSSFISLSPVCKAQDQGDAAANKDAKKRAKQSAKEMGSAYGDWLKEEVPLIITEEEKRAFLGLSTNEEREQFIERFWDRRNPEPDSPVNSYREDYYRRLAYADERFASGVPGRKTDRGRIYIIWGPPDEIEAHPTGGTWDRPMALGGGSTTTVAWEMWRYRYMGGIGENIEIEFVDPSGTGEYRITADPCEKDAMTRVPGAGSSLSESLGISSRASRFTNSNGTTCPMAIGGTPASMEEFENMERYFRVQQAPGHFHDLAEKVTSRLIGRQLPFEYRAEFLRATSGTDLVPITIELRNRDLGFQQRNGVHSAILDLYVRISDPGGRVVQTFEDVVSKDIPASLFPASQELTSIYQKIVPLRAGLYRIDIVIKDTQNDNVGVLGTALRVPRLDEEKLEASSLILADQTATASGSQLGNGQFLREAYRVRPRLSHEYSGSEKLGIYLQIYNLQLDELSRTSKVMVTYRITRAGEEVWHAVETAEQLPQGGEQFTLQKGIPVNSLAPGKYTIEVIALDTLTNQTVTRSAEFTIKAQPKKGAVPGPQSWATDISRAGYV